MKRNLLSTIKRDLRRNWSLYLVILPVVTFYFFFEYKPMYGALIAFQDYRPAQGFGKNWVGFKHFERFFNNPFFFRLLKNTLTINVTTCLFGFPAPIILALLLNELKSKKFLTISQTIMYLPHFISTVIICSMLLQFSLSDGLFNDILTFFGRPRSSLLQDSKAYVPLYVGSSIWKDFAWNSIIYVAAIAGVDTQLYDAASVDGAGKWKQMIHVTLPAIAPTITIKLILAIGNMMSLGYEKTMLLYNPTIYDVADIISTYVYRYGMEGPQYSYASAVGLFNSTVNIILVTAANKISRKVSETSLWYRRKR